MRMKQEIESFDAEKRPLRVCYFGTYRKNYGRNQILLNGLRASGVDIIECHEQLWQGIEDRVEQASGGWLRFSFIARVIRTYARLIVRHFQTPQYDVMMLGYPGQFDAYLGRVLSWIRRKPMAIDLYMSLYLIATERGLVEKSPTTGEVIRKLEQIGLNLCNMIICDTVGYRTYHGETYGLAPDRFRFVPAGADDRLFYPRDVNKDERPFADKLVVAYHGTFLPSHGLETIIEAAELLRDEESIQFVFFGIGPEEEKIRQMATDKGLPNVSFSGWIERPKMAEALTAVDICLGVFGTTMQSRITVQNKIWEGLALQLPIVSGRSPTVEDALEDRSEIYLVERENPQDLANAIKALRADPELRDSIAENGLKKFQQGHTLEGLGSQLRTHLEEVASR